MKPVISQKFITAGLWTLVGSVVIMVLVFSLIRYGDVREQAGVEKAVRAYNGGIVRPEPPNRLFMTGKDVPDIQLHFGLFTELQVSGDGKYFVLDQDEELPIAATLPLPKP